MRKSILYLVRSDWFVPLKPEISVDYRLDTTYWELCLLQTNRNKNSL